jgi:hypothetical protein
MTVGFQRIKAGTGYIKQEKAVSQSQRKAKTECTYFFCEKNQPHD